jgi:hypothetical protein
MGRRHEMMEVVIYRGPGAALRCIHGTANLLRVGWCVVEGTAAPKASYRRGGDTVRASSTVFRVVEVGGAVRCLDPAARGGAGSRLYTRCQRW